MVVLLCFRDLPSVVVVSTVAQVLDWVVPVVVLAVVAEHAVEA